MLAECKFDALMIRDCAYEFFNDEMQATTDQLGSTMQDFVDLPDKICDAVNKSGLFSSKFEDTNVINFGAEASKNGICFSALDNDRLKQL
eukprot:12424632-Karenia_brevis.AAC.1